VFTNANVEHRLSSHVSGNVKMTHLGN
jgi:hypothetical protein